mmetsp:Transcript_82474/g.237097  ORF Transcript_82474/g.237097 Transcript_82474/m.237097 type:complete len:629 (-) Transcript_82474:89-1975(-)
MPFAGMAAGFDFSWREAGPIFLAADDLAKDKRPEEVLTAAKEQLDVARESGDKQAQASALLASTLGYLGLGASEKTLLIAGDARRLLRVVGRAEDEVTAVLLIAALQLRNGAAEDALCAAEEAQSMCKERGDRKAEASSQCALARSYLQLARPEEALRAASAAASTAALVGDKRAQAGACILASQALASAGSAVAAQGRAEESVALYKAAGDKHGEAQALRSLAEAHLLKGDAAAALTASGDAAALSVALADDAGRAGSLCITAEAQRLSGDSAAALKSAREALILFRKADDNKGVQLAKEKCAALRSKSAAASDVDTASSGAGISKAGACCIPGVSGPGGLAVEPWVNCLRVCGTAESKRLSGMVAVVTGASRGTGKGTAQMLAQAGAVVYVTGRSSTGSPTDPTVPSTVDDTAAGFSKAGGTGVGVAVHMDHTQADDNRALVDVVSRNHGRLDILVNNAPCNAPADASASAWLQPASIGSDLVASTAFDRTAQTLQFAPCLRRGRGLVVDFAEAGAHNSASGAAVAEQLRDRSVHLLSMAPGCVKSEKSMVSAQQVGAKLIDLESTRFSGQAVAKIAAMDPTELSRFSSSHRALCTAAAARFELDGYTHEAEVQTFATSGRTTFVR